MVLDKIPTEILLNIGKSVESEMDLGALVFACRRTYITLNDLLYERNLFESHPEHSCILWAARNNSLDTIKRAQSYGADLDVYNPRSELRITIVWSKRRNVNARKIFSPLHASIMKGHHRITEYLLDNGASTDIPSMGLCSCHAVSFRPLFPAWFPLHTALCHAKEGEISSRMLIRYGARKEAAACPGLSFQTVSCQPSLARLVADLGGLREGIIDISGLGPLHLASQSGMDDVIKLILADPETNIRTRGREDNTSVLHCSVSQRRLSTTKLLLEVPGIEIETVDSHNRNVVFAAARGCNDGSVASVISLLVKGGANINLQDRDGVTPLYAAASRPGLYDYPNFKAVEALLIHGADPLIYEANHNQWTIFHQLLRPAPNIGEVVNSRRFALKRLIELGLEFETRTFTQNDTGLDFDSDATPLFFAAAQAQDPECTEILLQAGARPNTIVLNREDPSHVKEQSFLGGVFRHLWQAEGHGISPPLSQAGEIIAMLLGYGARLEDVNGEESPLQFVCRCPKQRMDYALLDFVLELSTRKNVSLKHVERVISLNELESGKATGVAADHHNIVVHKLQKFREREFAEEVMIEDDSSDADVDGDMDVDDDGDVDVDHVKVIEKKKLSCSY
ncbi:ankyrin repeat-containing domain protein [Trichoderma barbatum]